MALSLGVAALFIGVAFIIVGYKGGGTGTMNANIGAMLRGDYLPNSQPNTTVDTSKPKSHGATATTGGANSSSSTSATSIFNDIASGLGAG